MLSTLIFLAVAFTLLVALPLMILSVFLKVILGLVLLPFRLVAGVFQLVFGLGALLLKLLFGALGFLAFAVVAILFVVAIPLLPLLVLGALVWGVARLISGPSPARLTA
jgi:hypothetical protein